MNENGSQTGSKRGFGVTEEPLKLQDEESYQLTEGK